MDGLLIFNDEANVKRNSNALQYEKQEMRSTTNNQNKALYRYMQKNKHNYN